MSYCDQGRLFTFEDFFADGDDNHRLLLVLSALEDDALIGKLECQRKGRRDHYPLRMLWQSLVGAKVPTLFTKSVNNASRAPDYASKRIIREYTALRRSMG